MNDNNIYYFRKISNSSSFSEDEVLPLEKLNILSSSLWSYDNFRYSFFSIPSNICELLLDLVDKYGLTNLSSEFITLLAIVQKNYFEEKHHLPVHNSLDENFLNISKDLSSLFDIIERFLFSNDKNYLKSIYFKNKTGNNPSTIENFFIIQDVYSALIDYYGFTQDNFEDRKMELLSDEETSKFKDTAEIYKTNIIKELYNFLQNQDLKKTDSLRFIGVFLHLAQIQTNNNYPVEVFDFLKDNEDSIDVKNLTHYTTRK